MTKTYLYPNSRAIRSRILNEKNSDGFLPNYLTIGEFLQRIIRVDGYHTVDEDSRTLMLLEAADFKHFAQLNIERNFFTFTENAGYLFRFFEELSGELVDMDTLVYADTYGEYEEHITILRQLYRRYKELCDERKILDRIYLPQQYSLNEAYLRSLGEIEVFSLGYHTNFELEIFMACAKVSPFRIHFDSNDFSGKMSDKFRKLGLDIHDESRQLIDFHSMQVSDIVPLHSEIKADVASFSQSLLQVAFVKQKVYEMISQGISPEGIVVVLPDEGFAEHLKRFDTENNFNFAMGISLAHSDLVDTLQAAMDYLDNSSVENGARISRVGRELMEELRPVYQADINSMDFSSVIEPFIKKEQDEMVVKSAEKALYYFEKILPSLGNVPLKSALHLFMKRLKRESIDDVRGGRITVMGVLETRLVNFEGVIVVDFNENVVPRRSEKDLFLNSSTRHNAGLPTTREREALQKLYYHSLFSQAKKLAISYVHSHDAVPSRFLTQLGLPLANELSDEMFASIVMPMKGYKKEEAGEIKAFYDFTKRTLSNTGLSTYLTCKRKFYHRYIEGIKNHEIPQDMPKEHEIGSDIHRALQGVYSRHDHFTDSRALSLAVGKELSKVTGKSELQLYQNRLWMQRLIPFFETEIERFREVRVLACEKKLEREIRGIRLYGEIDRIDRSADGLEVLDYKSGKYKTYTAKTIKNATDFQLEFYYLLASGLGEVSRCGFYDLKEGRIVDEALLPEKLEMLYGILDELREAREIDFEKTEKLNDCQYCEFAYLCQRGLQ